jgi:hypothetical protein
MSSIVAPSSSGGSFSSSWRGVEFLVEHLLLLLGSLFSSASSAAAAERGKDSLGALGFGLLPRGLL